MRELEAAYKDEIGKLSAKHAQKVRYQLSMLRDTIIFTEHAQQYYMLNSAIVH